MKTAAHAPAPLNEDQLAALDALQSVASKGLNADDRATLEGLADVIAGRTYGEAEVRARTDKLKAEIKRRHNV